MKEDGSLRTNEYRGISEETLALLEFSEIRRILASFASTPPGKERARRLLPFRTLTEAGDELETFRQCAEWLESEGSSGLGMEEDPIPILKRLTVEGTVVEFSEILVLTGMATIGLGLEQSLRPLKERYPRLSILASQIPDFRAFVAEIGKKILPGGELADNASPELNRLRRQITICRDRIRRILQEYVGSADSGLQDEFITLRNDRYVLPVRRDHPKRLEGVVHGTSSSGATLFIEPMKTLEMNNQLIQLCEQERAEMARIRSEICGRIHARLPEWMELVETIGYMDLLTAKVRFASAFAAVPPVLSEESVLLLSEARHPLLVEQFSYRHNEVVPISLEMGGARQVLVLSGPNAGGKTVALKTIGLLLLMGTCGLPVPALQARLPFLHNIQANIGDQQSIQENLSTFSAHLQALKGIMERVKPEEPALVLLDELGTGTDPEQGAALAIAVIERLMASGALVVVTTHYNRLKAYGYEKEGAANMAVEFDTVAMCPTYRLLDGVAGSSSGLAIAERLGFPRDVIDAARRIADPAELETDRYLESIRQKMSDLEKARMELGLQRQMLEEERENLRRDLHRQKERLETERIARLEEQAKQFLSESEKILQEAGDEARKDRIRQKVRRQVDQVKTRMQRAVSSTSGPAIPIPAASGGEYLPKAGDHVHLIGIEQNGVVERVDLPFVEVLVSGKRWRFRRSEIAPMETVSEQGKSKLDKHQEIRSGITVELESESEVPLELNLIGCTGEEAVERTDKYLDQASLSGLSRVRLIHGHGKGILRKVLHNYLKGHPHVSSTAAAADNEGGQAVTIVHLRY